jgi:hypothetical protein
MGICQAHIPHTASNKDIRKDMNWNVITLRSEYCACLHMLVYAKVGL